MVSNTMSKAPVSVIILMSRAPVFANRTPKRTPASIPVLRLWVRFHGYAASFVCWRLLRAVVPLPALAREQIGDGSVEFAATQD